MIQIPKLHMLFFKRITLIVIPMVLIACTDQADPTTHASLMDKTSLSTTRSTLAVINERASLREIHQVAILAGIANAETGLTHCWADATWSCQGPSSSSCRGGAIVAGAGDGPCWKRQGGLGLFQLDGGTYAQTLHREGSNILTLAGNIDAGIDFIIRMVKTAKRLRSDQAAIEWINGISVGGSRYFEWIDIVVEYYNGCRRNSCSVFSDRWYHYDGKTRAILSEVERLPSLLDEAWIGSACENNSDCLFSIDMGVGRCLSDGSRGVCVAPCEGYCPDRAGFATTFCVTASQFNAGSGGLCMASPAENDQRCAEGELQVVNRYIGTSKAPPSSTRVCVPYRSSVTHEDTDEQLTELIHTETAGDNDHHLNTSCEDRTLPLSQEYCSGRDEEQWRCACHHLYAEPISQVCRGGMWVNYRLNPVNCSQCQGIHSNACE